MKITSFILFGGLAAAGLLQAAPNPPPRALASGESVLRQDDQAMLVRGGKSTLLEEEVTVAGDVNMMTNGFFTVKGGKERELKAGQSLSEDGTLTSADGSVMPVWDHVAMKNGRITVVRDGEGASLEQAMTLPDGSTLLPDGLITRGVGGQDRLLDGQLLRLDGTPLAAKDTITKRDNKVVVQKDGSVLTLAPGRSIMMNDGTKVTGDGTVIMSDGRTISLAEGQILTVEGVVRKK
jgi:hypothetical protein